MARTLQRAKDRSVGTPKAQLRRLDDAGNAVEMVEQVRPVDNRIQGVIGLDSDAFLRTVILPQGRFARLLVEDRPADRSRILSQVWRTDELEAAGAAAGAARQEIAVLRARLAQAASEYPSDPAAHLAWLRRELNTAQAAAADAEDLERDVNAAHAALTTAERAEECARGVGERLRTSGIDAGGDHADAHRRARRGGRWRDGGAGAAARCRRRRPDVHSFRRRRRVECGGRHGTGPAGGGRAIGRRGGACGARLSRQRRSRGGGT